MMLTRSATRDIDRSTKLLRGIAIGCAVAFLIGLFVDPKRVWASYLLGFNFVVGMALAGGLFVAVLTLSSAKWARSLLIVPEAMARVVPALAGLGIVLLFGVHALYEWSHAADAGHATGSGHAADPILEAKAPYLNTAFFAIRLIIFFGLWTILIRSICGKGGRALRASAVFMAVFTITYSLATFDWLMSLEPHWFSTIFALYQLAGSGLSGLGAAVVLIVLLRRAGPLATRVSDDQLQTLGRLLLSLSVFWVYIWYSQYMLIWYAHLPEETTWYALRQQPPWQILTPAILVMNWVIPFVVLLPKAACRSEGVLLRIGILVILGRLVDLYLQTAPPILGPTASFGLWELVPVVGCAALFFWLTIRGIESSLRAAAENEDDEVIRLPRHSSDGIEAAEPSLPS